MSATHDEVQECEKLLIQPTGPPPRKILTTIKTNLIKQYMPLGFLVVLGVALLWDDPGKKVKDWEVGGFGVVSSFNVFTVFLVSGLTLKSGDVLAALSAFPGLIYGLISILFLTPCIGFGLIKLPLSPDEFSIGLAIFAAMPTTITSGVLLVTQAYGNGTLALMLTVVSNLIGILTVPFGIKLIVASGTSVEIDAVDLLIKLVLTILVPLIIGKIARDSSESIQSFATKHRVALDLISGTSLICIVWQNLSESRDALVKQSIEDIILIILAGVGLHLTLLAVNSVLLMVMRLEEPEWKAVLIVSSQKTFSVAMTVVSYLDPNELGNVGLITISCIVGYFSQVFIDAVIVSRWASQHLKENPELMV